MTSHTDVLWDIKQQYPRCKGQGIIRNVPTFYVDSMDVKEMGERVFAAERLLKKRIRKVGE